METPATSERPSTALSELLEGFRAKKGWSYRQVADEIKKQTGYSRTESTVRFCIQGHAGRKDYRHRGIRTTNGEPSTLALVARVLGLSEAQLSRAYAQDLLEQGLNLGGIRIFLGEDFLPGLSRPSRTYQMRYARRNRTVLLPPSLVG